MSNAQRNSYCSATNPPPVLDVETSSSKDPSSKDRSSSSHSSSRSGSRHHSSRTSSSHGSSRAASEYPKASQNQFARMAAAGDIPAGSDPFSKAALGALHRSNAIASHSSSKYNSSSSSSHRSSSHGFSHGSSTRRSDASSAATIRAPTSSSKASSMIGMTRANSTSSSSAASYSTKKYSSASMPVEEDGALVPVRRSNTVATRSSSSGNHDMIPASGAYGAPAHVPASTSTARTGPTIINITNINIGSNNVGGSGKDPLGGFTSLEISGGSSRGGRGHGGRVMEISEAVAERMMREERVMMLGGGRNTRAGRFN